MLARLAAVVNIVMDGHTFRVTGGLERFTAELASAMAGRGHEVFYFVRDSEGSAPPPGFHPRIRVVHHAFTGDSRERAAFRNRIVRCAPDVCLAATITNQHLPWCAALAGTGIPWIYSEHTPYRRGPRAEAPQPISCQEPLGRLERLAPMAGADAIHLLLPDYARSVPPCLRDRTRSIPNPARPLPPVRTEGAAAAGRFLLLSLCRLHAFKQNDLLVRAFARLACEFPAWDLEIWGEGDERSSLDRLIRESGMTGRARLCGVTAAPEAQYARAAVFCLPSRSEGLPFTLLEAMSAGVPCVGFSACPGVNTLIVDGTNGLLAPRMTEESLAAALRALMRDAAWRARLGDNARDVARSFAPGPIYDAWEALLTETAAAKGHTRLQDLDRVPAIAVDNPERAGYLRELEAIVHRRHVLLRDSERLRLFLRRHPRLRAMAGNIRALVRR